MATKNRIAYALPIIQIMEILSAKSYKQMRLRLIYRERVGVTEQLKAENQLLWIQKMNNIRMCVKENVNEKIILK